MTQKPDGKSSSYLQVALAMLSPEGLSKVRAMKPEPSKHSVLRAVMYLRAEKHGPKAEELARYVRHHWPIKKGKTKPALGDVRLYRVHNQDDTDYSRIPVGLLGVKKGDFVQVVFEGDKLTVRGLPMDTPMKYVEARKAALAKLGKKKRSA
jgi:hypothetical protein